MKLAITFTFDQEELAAIGACCGEEGNASRAVVEEWVREFVSEALAEVKELYPEDEDS